MSENCLNFINERLLPLRDFVKGLNKDTFEPDNISEDSGINDDPSKARYMRDYQSEAIKQLIFTGMGRGILDLCTSSGKSFIIANTIWTLHKQYNNNLKYLVYVPTRQLVDQMYSDFLEYGYDKKFITRLSSGLKKDDKFNPDAHVIISNRQYLFTNKDKLPKIDVLFNDECHQTSNSNSTTYDFVDNFDCNIKFACTGTFPKDNISKWNLNSIFGRVVYQQSVTDLQERGFVAKLKIDMIKVRDSVVDNDRNYLFHRNPIRRFNKDNPSDILFDQAYRDEIEYINKHYIDLYTPILDQLGKYNDNMLILFDRIEFGKNMFELAKQKKIRNSTFYYIDGSIDVKERENIRHEFEQSGNNILFAQTSTFSTGISIKRLTNVVFVFSSKSSARVIQAVGRTLRLHKEKDYAQVIDICFDSYKYSHKHMLERMEIYRQTYNKQQPDNVIELKI